LAAIVSAFVFQTEDVKMKASIRKFNFGVFTQPGPRATELPHGSEVTREANSDRSVPLRATASTLRRQIAGRNGTQAAI
jgi:hypothetical protein